MEKQTFQTSVDSQYLQAYLFMGVFIATLGASGLLYGALASTHESLHEWGFFLALGSFLLIPIGLYPYKKLKSLEKSPNTLELDEGKNLLYREKGLRRDKIPAHSINAIHFKTTLFRYGIELEIKTEAGLKKKFFPYFSKWTEEEMKSYIPD